MVEAVGMKGVISVQRVAAPQPTTPVAAVSSATASNANSADPATDQVAAGGLARQLAAQAPVDMDRVQEIKKAIANGTFPLVPTTIADRMIALKLQWRPHDEA